MINDEPNLDFPEFTKHVGNEGRMNTELGANVFLWLQKAVYGLLVAAICAGIFLPVYTDEVGWRFQERAALDGVDKLFSDLCGPNTLATPPFFMMPVRYYSAFFNSNYADPFYVRTSGVLYALLWSVLVIWLIRKISRSRLDRLELGTLGAGLMCLGMMPLMLVWSRPEQPILLAITAALICAWTGNKDPSAAMSGMTSWFRSARMVIFATIAFSYHLKAVFLLPVFLACIYFASHGRQARLPRVVMALLLTTFAGWATYYWVHRMQCPDDPVLRALYARNSLGVYLTSSRNLSELLAAITKIIGNLDFPRYFAMPAPRTYPMSLWVEANQIGELYSTVWRGGLFILWSASLVLALACMFISGRTAWRERHIDQRVVFAGTLLVTTIGWGATQAQRNLYDATFVLPLVMLAVLIALSGRDQRTRVNSLTRKLASVVGGCAILSVPTVAAIYAPSIAHANEQTAYIDKQPFSQPVFGYALIRADILGAARKCGIGDPTTAKGLMIDDVTYFAFMKSRLPQHQLGVLGLWRGSIGDPVAYLRSRTSDGAILGCRLLPQDLRRRAKRRGQFCCLSLGQH